MQDNYNTRILYRQGNIDEILTFLKYPGSIHPAILKLSKDEYMIYSTGEVKRYNSLKNKDPKNVQRTVTKMRRIINCNFFGEKNELFITLTYKENMTDTERLYRDLDKFIKRLKYRLKCEMKYIMAVEPQKRGAWHLHILLKVLGKKIMYIPNKEIAELWGKGFTSTKRMSSVSNVGAYMSAYLINQKGKKYERLDMYPKNMRIYRISKNCTKAEKIIISKETHERIKKEKDLSYKREYIINNDEGEMINAITREQYI